MKLRFLALLAACTVLCSFAACQKEPAATNDTATSTTDTSSASEAPESSLPSQGYPGDQAFVTGVGQAGMTEIKTGQEAESKSSNADVKTFGATMITQHTQLGDELQQLAASNGFTFPPDNDFGPGNQPLLDELAPLSGSAFDQSYINGMVQAHQGAVTLFEEASASAQNPDLKSWAAKNLGIIKHHLEMAEEVKAKLPQ
jgi:putative membrane protein